jgi:hypothetical protein
MNDASRHSPPPGQKIASETSRHIHIHIHIHARQN